MSRFPGLPLFDTADRLDEQADLNGYSCIQGVLASLPLDQERLERDLRVSLRYLQDYSSVPGTYTRFRSEVQRFLNYLWIVCHRTLDQVDHEVAASYFKFLKNPPAAWLSEGIAPGFIDEQGLRVINPRWRPFTTQRAKGKRYTASPASLKSSRTALSSYFRFLQFRGVLSEDPLLQVRRRETKAKSSALVEQPETSVRRYTDWQWSFIKETLELAADSDPGYERHLFVVITMKTLFLRVSELAVRQVDGEARIPAFSDFKRHVSKGQPYWTFYVFGKGDKGRTITCPDGYLSYLERWRSHIGCDSPLPLPKEAAPVLPSRKGGGLGSRQVQRICEDAIVMTAERMKNEGFKAEAQSLKAIKTETHYLRHTGASQAFENGADIRHISEELGHGSAAFTEQLYVHADQARRREAGRNRSI